MVSFPASMDFEAGITFTVGAFTWTSGMTTSVAFTGASQPVPAPSTAQLVPALTAPTSSPTTLTPGSSAPPMTVAEMVATLTANWRLPHYQRTHIDNFDLVDMIDRQGAGLVKILYYVESTRGGFTKI